MDDSRLFERTVSSAIQYSGPVFDVYSDTVELCNKKTARRDYLKHRGAVAVVPLTDNGGVIIERQFRYPQQRVMTRDTRRQAGGLRHRPSRCGEAGA